MDKIIKTLVNPAFFIPALIISLIAGIGANYLRSLIDTAVSFLKGRYKQKKKAREEKIESYACEIANNPVLFNMFESNLSIYYVWIEVWVAALVILLCMVIALPVKNYLVMSGGIGFAIGRLITCRHECKVREKKKDIAYNIYLKKSKQDQFKCKNKT